MKNKFDNIRNHESLFTFKGQYSSLEIPTERKNLNNHSKLSDKIQIVDFVNMDDEQYDDVTNYRNSEGLQLLIRAVHQNSQKFKSVLQRVYQKMDIRQTSLLYALIISLRRKAFLQSLNQLEIKDGYLIKIQDTESFGEIAKHAAKMYFYLHIKYEDIYDLLQIQNFEMIKLMLKYKVIVEYHKQQLHRRNFDFAKRKSFSLVQIPVGIPDQTKNEKFEKIFKTSDIIENILTIFIQHNYNHSALQDRILSVIKNLQDQLDYQRIIRVCWDNKLKNLLDFVIDQPFIEETIKKDFTIESINYYLQINQLDQCAIIIKDFRQYLKGKESQALDYIIYSFKTPSFMEFKIFLISQLFDYLKYRQVDQIMNEIEANLDDQTSIALFSQNLNPIKIGMSLIDLMFRIQNKFKIATFRTDKINGLLEEQIQKIIKDIQNSDELKYLLKQKDLLGNDSLYYMSLHNVYSILDTKSTDRIIQDFWKILDGDHSHISKQEYEEIGVKYRYYMFQAGEYIYTAMIVSILMLSYPIRMFQTWLFARFLNRKYVMLKAINLIEIGYTICALLWLYKYAETTGFIDDPHEFDRGFDKNTLFVHNQIEEINFGTFRFDILISVQTGFMWLKVMLLLKLTRSFGPLLKIIERMIQDFMYFTVIWGINLAFFTFMGMLLFTEIPLFQRSLYGKIYQIFFLIVNLILLINLMIAILSTTFSDLHNLQLALYYDEIIEAIPQYKYDKVYGSLICGTPPVNIIMLPFTVVYLLFKDIDKLTKINSMLVKIAYAPNIFVLTPIFMIGNIFFIPFGYLCGTFALIRQLCRDRSKALSKALLEIVLFIIFAPIVLIASQLTDIFVFLKHLFSRRNEKLSHFQKPCISKSVVQKIYLMAQDMVKKNKDFLSQVQLVKELRDTLGIENDIMHLIYGDSLAKQEENERIRETETIKINPIKSKDESLIDLKIFNTIKCVIKNCTNENGLTNVKLLHTLLQEVQQKINIQKKQHPFILNLKKTLRLSPSKLNKSTSNIQGDNSKIKMKRRNQNQFISFQKKLMVEFSFSNPNRVIQSLKDVQNEMALKNQKILNDLTRTTELILKFQRSKSQSTTLTNIKNSYHRNYGNQETVLGVQEEDFIIPQIKINNQTEESHVINVLLISIVEELMG
ncbi:UNKNOWN [Stylonychia lemnae]|uniref:Uncharacterized protein n=1 Tax=Stylonychia lemnae TaxID=5949 RepID=A0A077ZZY1_STYLE|nr:UNKNOWN [Stylonychia lemnae]|eukprot:CDW75491.1 UNKNOWN [Stylonychia lemnae]